MSGYKVDNILPGGQPDIKPVEPKKPVVRQPQQLSNRDDIAAIHNHHTTSRNIESLVASLHRLLTDNREYVGHAREFLKLLSAEIEEKKSDNVA